MKKEDQIKKERLDQYDFAWDESERIFAKKSRFPKSIGEFFIAFSNLESSLNILIAEAINDRSHDLGYQVLKSLQYRNKVQLGRDLYAQKIRHLSKPVKSMKRINDKFIVIFRMLLDLGIFRNKIAHANWMTLDKKSFVRTKIVEDDGEIVFMKVKITPAIIGRMTSRCNYFANWIYDFPNKIN